MSAEARSRRTQRRAQKRNGRKEHRCGVQEQLFARTWGGARPGSGRKRQAERPQVPHRSRPTHCASKPVQVTARLVSGLGSLRRREELRLIESALDQGSVSGTFQVVHHSVQSNHLHLIVEARDRRALTEGLRGLWIRIARRLNVLWGRRGPVFSGRYHERSLETPREVRNALVYVLQNSRKHGVAFRGPDPYTSGMQFDGWELPPNQVRARVPATGSSSANRSPASPPKASATTASATAFAPQASSTRSNMGSAHAKTVNTQAASGAPANLAHSTSVLSEKSSLGASRQASSWLLAIGWRRYGLIGLNESPR